MLVVWKNDGGVNDAAVAVATSDDDDDDDDDDGGYVQWLAIVVEMELLPMQRWCYVDMIFK